MQVLKNVQFQKNGMLSVVQFKTDQQDTLQYISIKKAIEQQVLEVKEVSEGGSVNNLAVFNLSENYIFLMDGDILMGAKQNRTLNTSILIKPNSKTIIPVSCVEQGRWSRVSNTFTDCDLAAPTFMRGEKLKDVSDSLRSGNAYHSNQGKVWANVNSYQKIHKVSSETSNLLDVYEGNRTSIEEFIKSYSANLEANGLALFNMGKMLSMDVFNRKDVYQEYFMKIIKGAALEVIHLKQKENNFNEAEGYFKVLDFSDTLTKMKYQEYKGAGEGIEKRFEGEIVGSELSFKNNLVHLSAFYNNK